MIQVAELRIGNWVEHNGRPVQVEGVDRKGALIELPDFKGEIVMNFHYLEGAIPIPLSPDILEKCGFVKDRNGWQLPGTQFSLTELFYPFWIDNLLWPQDVEEFKNRSLPYLHELQNILFSLTKKELTINL